MKNILLITFVGFMLNVHANPQESANEDIKMNKIADQLSINFSKKMEKKFNFELNGMGGGGFHDINTLSLHFECAKVLDLVQARNLIVEVASEFIENINNDKNIKNYLRNYPANVNNIRLLIGFGENNEYPVEGKIAFIHLSDGKLDYSTFDHEKNTLKNVSRETYDEAAQIVAKQNESQKSNLSNDSNSESS